jgi:nucleoside-diphosphate-sugar epimerase
MKVLVVGASGNVGSAVLRRLAREPAVTEIVGVCRRIPSATADPPFGGVEWRSIDVADHGATVALSDAARGAQVVIHLAWQIQPSHDQARLRRTNVQGTANVAEAAIRAGVPALIVASSVGAYAPGPKDLAVDESWPTTGGPLVHLQPRQGPRRTPPRRGPTPRTPPTGGPDAARFDLPARRRV